ncbi:hypothetical protein [Sphingomonas sp. PP-CC-3G-468]|uniref:hypothetical protein n=1 Tax=Sphingomonas sp. PP-CC-3G-468 TaxID=2135656 RepID=UPI0010DDB972|nr:hypothetical protein [Sphingomonas sp. PP-CC-3G-468]TCM07481.1 Hpr(Ser) kinase/phosphatase [Sphingomonas sp. PP-CC-3G-468]
MIGEGTDTTTAACTFDYIVAGLHVRSDLRLPGLIEAAVWWDPSITVRRASLAACLPDVISSGPTWQMADERFLLEIPGIVRMLLCDGRDLWYEPIDGTCDSDIDVFVGGTGLGLLLQQRGWIVLHASAVRVGDAAVLFCGASGAGKSTLAAALGGRGFDLVADDFCGITVGTDGVGLVHPDGRRLKLWDDAIERLALADRRRAAVRPTLRKFHVEPHATSVAALPVAAVYVLGEARPPAVPGIMRANLVDAALLLRAQAYRPALVRWMGQQPLYLAAAAAVSRGGGVFTLTRTRRFEAMDAVLDDLATHWRELGMSGA